MAVCARGFSTARATCAMSRSPFPKARPDEVLVEITTNGLCGSDIHFYKEGKLGPFVVDKPYIPGHEACGIVVRKLTALGQKRASGWRWSPGYPAAHARCASPGDTPLQGRRVHVRSARERHVCRICGGSRRFRALFCRIPWTRNPARSWTGERWRASLPRAGLRAAASVAVIGAGPIGLVTMLVARAFGAATAFLIDRLPSRLALGASLGATATIDAGSTDPVARMAELTDGAGVDFVFDASGSSAACASAPAIAARGGSVTIIGWPEKSTFAYPVESIIEKELDVHGTNRYANAFPRAIALLASRKVDVHPLVSHRFRLDEVTEAFAFAADHPAETIKVMVRRE